MGYLYRNNKDSNVEDAESESFQELAGDRLLVRIFDGMNNKIKSISHRPSGFRNAEYFIAAIYHRCARLPLPADTLSGEKPVFSTLGAVEELFVPRHLNGFELRFVGFLRVVLEFRKLDHVAVQ